MKNSNECAFLNAVKSVVNDVPYSESDREAKRVVAIAIKTSGVSMDVVLNYIMSLCNIPEEISKDDWKAIVNYHRNWGGKFGKILNITKNVSQNQFVAFADVFGMNVQIILMENKIDQFGWLKVYEALKSECDKELSSEIVDETPVETLDSPGSNVPASVPTKTRRIIVMKNKDGEIVAEYKTSKEAFENTGICECSVRKNLNGYSNYQNLKDKDGNSCSFEYKEVPVITKPKTATRKYNRNKIVVVNLATNAVAIYDNAIQAANAIGVKPNDVYYRVKTNHKVNDMFSVWFENDFTENEATGENAA